MLARHISQDEVTVATRKAIPMEYDASWTKPENYSSEPAPPAADLFFWTVPTSLFFGMTITKMGTRASRNNEKKQRLEVVHTVRNPIEDRVQTEAFHDKSYVGVVLRGTVGRYGWASQPVQSDFPASVMNWSSAPRAAERGMVLDDLRALGSTMLNDVVRAGDARAHFNGEHVIQLEELGLGQGGQTIAQAFEEILAADPTSEYSLVAKAYGGGAIRAALTYAREDWNSGQYARTLIDPRLWPTCRRYERLISRVLSPLHRLLQPITTITVDEMFGGKILEYDHTKRHCLVGLEFRPDGSTKYVRLKLADTAPGETFWAVSSRW